MSTQNTTTATQATNAAAQTTDSKAVNAIVAAASSNDDILKMMAQMQAQMAAMKADADAKNAEIEALKARKPGGVNFAEAIRIYKTGYNKGKVVCRHHTQVELNALQILMLGIKITELVDIVKKFRGGSFERRPSMKTVQGKQTRNAWDDIFVTKDGEELHCGTVALNKLSNNELDVNENSPENVKLYQDRLQKWTELWAELEAKYGKSKKA
jgi:hypothetical protein